MSRRNPILQALSDPTKNFLSFFFIGVLLINIFSNGVSDLFWDNLGSWIQDNLNIPNIVVFRVLMLGLLLVITLLVIYFTNLTDWVRRALARFGLTDAIVPDMAKVSILTETCQGLVVIMSPKEKDTPAEIAIDHHWNNGVAPHLKYCWIICANESADYARLLEQRLIDDRIGEHLTLFYGNYNGIPDPLHAHQTLSLTVDDDAIHDPDQILHLVNGIYDHAESLGLSEEELIVDITGGTKPLGIGAFLACTRPERRLEYITLTEGTAKLVEIRVAYRLKAIR
ncbi:MAG: CRISPR-associated protein [Cyanobacteria bacterium J06659_2]